MSDVKIKVCFLHPWIKSIEDVLKLLCIQDMPIAERFELDYENPDYVIATDYVTSSYRYMKQFKRLVGYQDDSGKNPIRIFWTEECVSPDFNIFDYSITWNWKLSYRDRAARIPPHIFIGSNMTERQNTLSYEDAVSLLRQGNLRFCNFFYSNPGHFKMKRDELFYALQGYKHVDSLGKYLNNVGGVVGDDNKITEPKQGLSRGGRYSWQEVSVRLKSNYKFTIAAENAQSDGYTSEKLLTSFLAHSVPIYWGNPYVAEEYNPEAFINCNDYDNFDNVVKRVKEIDEDDELWARMVSQPWQTEQQARKSEAEYESYKKFIMNIFTSPIEQAYRRTMGEWVYLYGLWYFEQRFIRNKKRSLIGEFIKSFLDTDTIDSIGKLLSMPRAIFNPHWRQAKQLKRYTLEDFLKEKNFS
ncbi:MAG: hypothetical protein IJU48_05480 [Synergistaceae bacterium]|nr:hypothetical protein [Synergistaceae bacterium]